MKNISKYLFLFILTIGLFSSCEDEDLTNPLAEIRNAATVSFIIENEDINIGNTDPRVFIAQVDAQSRVVSYDIQVSRTSGGTTSEPIAFKSYVKSDFPFTLTIDAQTLADTFGVAVSDIAANDRFNFTGTTVDNEGTVYTIENFEAGNGFIPGTGTLQFNSDGYDFEIRIREE